MTSGDEQELPSSVGVGWENISVDDPERDRRILRNNIMRELCQMPEGRNVAISDILTIQAFERRYIEGFLRSFERETHYIERLSNGNIRLTNTGRGHCSEYT
jgi:hypothetical protein